MAKRIGPQVTVHRSCLGCSYLKTDGYAYGSGEGIRFSCAHPTYGPPRLIGFGRDTPDWCLESEKDPGEVVMENLGYEKYLNPIGDTTWKPKLPVSEEPPKENTKTELSLGSIPTVTFLSDGDRSGTLVLDGKRSEWVSSESFPDPLFNVLEKLRNEIFPRYEFHPLTPGTLGSMNASAKDLLWRWVRQGLIYRDLQGKKWVAEPRLFEVGGASE